MTRKRRKLAGLRKKEALDEAERRKADKETQRQIREQYALLEKK